MNTVATFINENIQDLAIIDPDDTVLVALRLMAERNIGALLVMKNNKLMGIFSERDYARKIVLHGRSSETTLVSEIMSKNVISVTRKHTLEECMQLMSEKRFRHLPILDGEQVIGMISIGDVMKGLMQQLRTVISQLEQYIMT